MANFETLLSPFNLAGIEMRSRVIQSGMVSNFSNEDGTVSDRLIAYHVKRAENGIGLQLVGASYIEQQAKGYRYQTAIHTDDYIPGLRKLTDAVHAAGGKIGIQVWHGGSQADPRYSGMELVSCSAIPTPAGMVPHELTREEIAAIVTKYADAAERAKKAGFDIVEIHGSHGYLIDQFYSSSTNKRTDEYGGSFENRIRFALEVSKAVRARVGADFPLSFRITAMEVGVEEPNTVADACMLANRLAIEADINLINVSIGGILTLATSEYPEALLADMAAGIRASLEGRAVVSVADRIKRPDLAEQLIQAGKTDLITMGRATVCDPEILTKAKEGRVEDIRMCASCNYCIATMMEGNRVSCMQNPMTGHEFEYDLNQKAEKAKKVVVVGSGPSGMQAAIVCAKRGHDVTVYEASGIRGGKVNVADKSPFKFEMEYVITNLSREADNCGVKFVMNTKADKDLVLAQKPDAVVIASGAVPAIPPIPGVDQPNVYTAQDVILGNVKAEGKTVIVGGGTVGIEAADFLLQQGNEVSIVEMNPAPMMDLMMMQQVPYMIRVLPRLSGLLTNTKVLEINGDKVVTSTQTLEGIDSVVLAAGYKSVNALADELKDSGVELCVVGDAMQSGKVFEACHTAFAAAYKI